MPHNLGTSFRIPVLLIKYQLYRDQYTLCPGHCKISFIFYTSYAIYSYHCTLNFYYSKAIVLSHLKYDFLFECLLVVSGVTSCAGCEITEPAQTTSRNIIKSFPSVIPVAYLLCWYFIICWQFLLLCCAMGIFSDPTKMKYFAAAVVKYYGKIKALYSIL